VPHFSCLLRKIARWWVLYIHMQTKRDSREVDFFYRKQQKITACAVSAAFHLVNSKDNRAVFAAFSTVNSKISLRHEWRIFACSSMNTRRAMSVYSFPQTEKHSRRMSAVFSLIYWRRLPRCILLACKAVISTLLNVELFMHNVIDVYLSPIAF
jgi:hypothetical protein